MRAAGMPLLAAFSEKGLGKFVSVESQAGLYVNWSLKLSH
jgi:hypothetical protein